MPTTITFVTGNANKLREVEAILASGPEKEFIKENYDIVSQKLDLDEVQGTIDQIATHKAQKAAEIVQGAVLVEDTCLGFNAFKNLPGPYIKWFLEAVGLDGLNKMLYKFEDKSANAICTFGFCPGPGADVTVFQGVTEGAIVSSRGPTNFGWDSIFEPKGFQVTYAEMDKEVKNTISHRYRALQKVKDFLRTYKQ